MKLLFCFEPKGAPPDVFTLAQRSDTIQFQNELDIIPDVNAKNKIGDTCLHLAAKTFQEENVAALLQRGADVNTLDEKGKTALLAAVKRAARGDYKRLPKETLATITTLTADREADINVADKAGCTALHYALSFTCPEVATLLIQQGASLQVADATGRTPMHIAAATPALTSTVLPLIIQTALTQGIDEAVVNAPDAKGRTPLHAAVMAKNKDAVVQLLGLETLDVNLRDADGMTAAHFAVQQKDLEDLELLLMCGSAAIDLPNEHHKTVADLANESGNKELIAIIDKAASAAPNSKTLDRGGQSPLHRAVMTGNTALLERCLALPSNDPNIKNSKGRTPLNLALQKYDFTAVKLLVDAKADVGIADADGTLPIFRVLTWPNFDQLIPLLTIFMEEGQANVNILDTSPGGNKKTPLHLAVDLGNEAATKLLLTKADPNIADASGCTPAHVAARRLNLTLLKMLKEADCNVATNQDKAGMTPLHHVSERFVEGFHKDLQPSVAYLVADCGADVNTKDEKLRTPWVMAIQADRKDILSQMLDIAAPPPDTGACDTKGRSALWLAAELADLELTKKLVEEGNALVDQVCSCGGSALHCALTARSADVVDYLVTSARANTNLETPSGIRPISLALASSSTAKHLPVTEFQRQRDTRMRMISTLIAGGADVNYNDKAGSSPLHVAVAELDLPLVKLLIDEGKADANALDRINRCPLNILMHPGAVQSLQHVPGVNATLPTKRVADVGGLIVKANRWKKTGANRKSVDQTPNFSVVQITATSIQQASEPVPAAVLSPTSSKDFEGSIAAKEGVLAKTASSPPSVTGSIAAVHDTSAGEPDVFREVRRQIMAVLVRDGHASLDNIVDTGGNLPLHNAVREGDVELLELLVKDGKADVDLPERTGLRPVSIAMGLAGMSATAGLATRTTFRAQMCSEVERNRRELRLAVMKLLIIDGKAKVNYVDEQGFSPLHYASQDLDLELVQLLIKEGGSDLNLPTPKGLRPLCLAMEALPTKLAPASLPPRTPQQADVKRTESVVNAADAAAGFIAPTNLYAESVRSTLAPSVIPPPSIRESQSIKAGSVRGSQKGSVAGGVAKSMRTAMTTAMRDTAKTFKKGTSVLAKSVNAVPNVIPGMPNQKTPEQIAAELAQDAEDSQLAVAMRLAVVEELVRSNADVRYINASGSTPLHRAIKDGDLALARLLVLEGHANVDAPDKDGFRPLCVALKCEGMGEVRAPSPSPMSPPPPFQDSPSMGGRPTADSPATTIPMQSTPEDDEGPSPPPLIRSASPDLEDAAVDIAPSRTTSPSPFAGRSVMQSGFMQSMDGPMRSGEQVAMVPMRFLMVQLLVSEGRARVNYKDPNGVAPIHYASGWLDVDVVRLLVTEGGADVDVTDANGWQPVTLALVAIRGKSGQRAKMEEMVVSRRAVLGQLVVDGKAKLSYCDPNGETPLNTVIREMDLELVKLMVHDGKANVDLPDGQGWRPVSVAQGLLNKQHAQQPDMARKVQVKKTVVAMLETLVDEASAQVNYADPTGHSPIHYASQELDLEVVKLLVNKGKADVDVPDPQGRRPVSLVMEAGAQSKAPQASSTPDGTTPEATDEANDLRKLRLQVLQVLLIDSKPRADVNYRDTSGYTPLHYAVKERDEDLTQLLVEHGGADINASEPSGMTPVLLATHLAYADILAALLQHADADTNSQDASGATSLHVAVQLRNQTLVDALLDQMPRVNPNAVDIRGWRPLEVALNLQAEGKDCMGIMEMLVKKGKLNLDYADDLKTTPLHKASDLNNPNLARLFVVHGSAPVNAQDVQGFTPLFRAVIHQFYPVAEYLVTSARADVTITDNNLGDTPLHVAVRTQQHRMVQLLVKEGGASVDVPNKSGITPVALAVQAVLKESNVSKAATQAAAGPARNRTVALHILTTLVEAGQGNVNTSVPVVVPDVATAPIPTITINTLTPSEAPITPVNAATQKLAAGFNAIKVVNLFKKKSDKAIAVPGAAVGVEHVIAAPTQKDVRASLTALPDMTAVRRPPLMWAIDACDVDLATLLVLKGHADANLADGDGNKPLSLCLMKLSAALTAQEKGVSGVTNAATANIMLLNQRVGLAPPTVNDTAANSTEATKEGSSKIADLAKLAVLMITKAGADVNAIDAWGNLPLHMLAVQGSKRAHVLSIATAAVKEGQPPADVNHRNDRGWTPIHVVVANSDLPFLRLLLSSPTADPNVLDAEGRTPLVMATQLGKLPIVECLAGDGRTDANLAGTVGLRPVVVAVKTGAAAVLSSLLKMCQVNVNVQEEGGLSPLHNAVLAGSRPMVQDLVVTGKSLITLVDAGQKTPVHLAAEAGRKDLCEVMLKGRGADSIEVARVVVNMRDINGRTPLHAAASLPNGKDLVAMMMDVGANPDMQDHNGQSPVHLAAIAGSDSLQYLVQNGANVAINDKAMKTPLDLVANAKLRANLDKITPNARSAGAQPMAFTPPVPIAATALLGAMAPPVMLAPVQAGLNTLKLLSLSNLTPITEATGKLTETLASGGTPEDGESLAGSAGVATLCAIKIVHWTLSNASGAAMCRHSSSRLAVRLQPLYALLQELYQKLLVIAPTTLHTNAVAITQQMLAHINSVEQLAMILDSWILTPATGDALPPLIRGWTSAQFLQVYADLATAMTAACQSFSATLQLVEPMRGVVFQHQRRDSWPAEDEIDRAADVADLEGDLLHVGRNLNNLAKQIEEEGVGLEEMVKQMDALQAPCPRLRTLLPAAPEPTPAVAAVAAVAAVTSAAAAKDQGIPEVVAIMDEEEVTGAGEGAKQGLVEQVFEAVEEHVDADEELATAEDLGTVEADFASVKEAYESAESNAQSFASAE